MVSAGDVFSDPTQRAPPRAPNDISYCRVSARLGHHAFLADVGGGGHGRDQWPLRGSHGDAVHCSGSTSEDQAFVVAAHGS